MTRRVLSSGSRHRVRRYYLLGTLIAAKCDYPFARDGGIVRVNLLDAQLGD